MTKRIRRNHAAEFKVKVALEAIKREWTIVELAQLFQVHPNLITEWKKQLLHRASEVFDEHGESYERELKESYAKIGELETQNDLLISQARAHSHAKRKEMICKEHSLPLTKQCLLLNLSRSGVYYVPVPASEKDRELMRLIGEIHINFPHMGTRSIRNELLNEGHTIGRIRVRTLMRKMGIEALGRQERS